jgi:molecular chaperone DnaJ
VFITLEELDSGVRKDIFYDKNEMCPSCKAMAPHQNWCSKCAGKGVVKTHAHTQDQLSPGLVDGQEVRMRGSGNFVPSYKTGDLILIIRLEKHPDFIKNGFDLYTTKKITFPEAALGTILELENLRKQKLNVKIQAGIQTGTQLVLHGQGLLKPSDHGAQNRGDLFLTITIGTPVDLTDVEKELYTKLLNMYL